MNPLNVIFCSLKLLQMSKLNTYLLSSFSKLLQRPTKSLCKEIRKLFKAKAHRPQPELEGRKIEIGVVTFISLEYISSEIENGPMT